MTNSDDSISVIQPTGLPGGFEFAEGGLTKREYFAAQVLQGILSNPNNKADDPETALDAPPKIAVMYADALIEALNKEAK